MTRSKEVVLVRHGETEWSRAGRHTSDTDLPLTATGRDQAVALGGALDGRDFGLILVSPARRALETTELAGFAERAEVDPDLREWGYGDYEGRTTADIRLEVPGWSIWTHPTPGGESADEVAARADRVIERAHAEPGDVALFGHGHLLRVLAARWAGLRAVDGSRLFLDTATVSVLGCEREVAGIERWNEPAFPGRGPTT